MLYLRFLKWQILGFYTRLKRAFESAWNVKEFCEAGNCHNVDARIMGIREQPLLASTARTGDRPSEAGQKTAVASSRFGGPPAHTGPAA
jgi:hypothetical protein